LKQLIKDRRGLTLLEIILSLALLGIIVVGFLGVFSGGFVTIISMGNKSRAGVEAQTIVDRVYAEAVFATTAELRDEVEQIVEEVAPGSWVDYTDDLVDFNEANTTQTRVRFTVTSDQLLIGSSVPVLTVQVYYQNFGRSVTISSPIVR
jgi:prepilin-type N-terminal cleavage/methylation domain-containing protein